MLRLSELHVHGRKNREDVGLNHSHDKLDSVNDNEDGQPSNACDTHKVASGKKETKETARKKGECRQTNMTSEHVGKKSNSERNKAQERGKRLDYTNQDVERE